MSCYFAKNRSPAYHLLQLFLSCRNDNILTKNRGHGEWEDPDVRTRCRILWRKPEQLASDIYDWAEANGYINSVCTVYELHSGKFHFHPKTILGFQTEQTV